MAHCILMWMDKNFDAWNTQKKIINSILLDKDIFYHERDIWWSNLGLNIGVEIDGKADNFERPVLIIKKFNADMVWILPISNTIKDDLYHYSINHPVIKGSVVLSQLRTISTKRLSRKFGMMSQSDFNNVIEKIRGFLKIKSPLAGAFSEAEATNT